VVAFLQGVRDEKTLEKLATHGIQEVVELFSPMDMCARRQRAMPTTPAPKAGKDSKPNAGATAQGNGNNNNNKEGGNNQPLAGAPTAVAAAAGGGRGPRGDKRPCQVSDSGAK
jgi:hypothetical protein